MMFHVKQNKKKFLCETKDYLATGERFKVFLDDKEVVGKTIPVPKKAEMYKYYKSEGYLPHSLNKKNFLTFVYSATRKCMHRKRFLWMKSYLKESTKVLDYGCGSGGFVKYLRDKSVNAYGYDPNVEFNMFGKFDFLTNRQLWENKKYDIIVLWHVLEHVHSPFALIQNLKKRLNKNGKIFIAIPNFKSFDSKYYGKYWAGYDTPRHLWHFSRKSIHLIAKKYNFKIFKEKSLHLDSIYVSYLSEKHKGSNFPVLLGSIIGLTSILKSLFTRECSSFGRFLPPYPKAPE